MARKKSPCLHWSLPRNFFFWVAFLFTFISNLSDASDSFLPKPVQVFSGVSAFPWERVELLADKNQGFLPESYAESNYISDPLIRKWFKGNPTPHSSQFLLHCGKNFLGKTFKTPVLLVHGASDNANRTWIHPWEQTMPSNLSHEKQGFARSLSDLGYSVFALTFPHNQGDNFYQAKHIANAISRIKILLGRANDANFEVDVIGHSKGNVPIRLYCSDANDLFPKKKFLPLFRGDVRKFIAIASPMRGVDTAFRYYGYNLYLAGKSASNAPLGVDRFFIYGNWINTGKRSVFTTFGNYFPGQCQILYNLVQDATVPLGPDSYTLDGNLTMFNLYFGGTTLFIRSAGITKAIEQGERLIYRLEERGIAPKIRLGVIAGSNGFVTYATPEEIVPMPYELLTPPGDGVVFLASSLFTDNILKRGAKLIGKSTLDLNHVEIARDRKTLEILDDWLRSP